MKLRLLITLVVVSVLSVSADWDPGDDHKMHWPQTPKPGGLDIAFHHYDTGIFWALGDDWQCSHTGPVTDIHFWISFFMDYEVPIPFFHVSIWSNDPMGPYGYSQPLDLLWEREFMEGQFTVRYLDPDLQGWYDPFEGYIMPQNHSLWAQINIVEIYDPFIQIMGEIYWLVIMFPDPQNWTVGWKETDQNWNDDAVWWDPFNYYWRELYNPETGDTIDLAFVITGPEDTNTEESTWSRIKNLY